MIVFCHLLNDQSGSPRVLRSTLQALDTERERLLFVGSHGRGALEETEVPTRRYWYCRSRYRLVTLFTFFASQIALYRALKRARDIPADAIVFVNTLLPFAAMLWGRRTDRRVIVHVHEVSISPAPLRWLLTRSALRCADQLLYVSEDHRSRLRIKGPPAEVVYNPVDPLLQERAKRAPAYAPRRSGAFEVLMLASLRSYKGIEEFMSVAQMLRDRTDICFVLVLNADPKEASNFSILHPDAKNVIIHPRTEDPELFYATADLLVNLSRTDQWIETFGLTLAEAMTFGIPVIAPPVGGPTEIVTHHNEGYCIDSRDTEAVRNAVLQLADDPTLAQEMSAAARTRALDFTFERYAQQIRKIVTEVRARV